MRLFAAIIVMLPLIAGRVVADPATALSNLRTLPRADVARLIGSWQVEEMAPLKMVYEFQSGTVAMHGRNQDAGLSFELTMDADYRSAGKDAIWVIASNPRAGADEEQPQSKDPSILGIQFTADDRAELVVSSDEHFTLVRIH